MVLICVKFKAFLIFPCKVSSSSGYTYYTMRKTYTHIELLDRFMSGKTSPEEEQTLLAWFSDPDHKEEIMAFYKSRWEESSGKKLPPKLQGQMFCEIKKRIRQEEKTLEIKKKPHYLMEVAFLMSAVALICIGLWNWLPIGII